MPLAEDLGPLLGAIPVAAAWLAREWWKTRSAQRADAADSANTKAEIRSLADFERRAKEGEADADKERDARLAAQRAQLTAEGLQHDAERDLRAARRDILMLKKKLKKAGVPDSDYVPLMETQIGDFPEP
jgi:hypothetical protein